MSSFQSVPARQRGMSMLTTLVVLTIAVFFLLIGIKMVPVYLENFALRDVLEEVTQDRRARGMPRRQLKDNIMRRLSINGVRDLPRDSIGFSKTREGRHIAVDYEIRKPIMGNVSVVMTFSESAVIPAK